MYQVTYRKSGVDETAIFSHYGDADAFARLIPHAKIADLQPPEKITAEDVIKVLRKYYTGFGFSEAKWAVEDLIRRGIPWKD